MAKGLGQCGDPVEEECLLVEPVIEKQLRTVDSCVCVCVRAPVHVYHEIERDVVKSCIKMSNKSNPNPIIVTRYMWQYMK